MWFRIFLNDILGASFETELCDMDDSNFLSLPSDARHHSHDGSSAYHFTTSQPHEVFVASHRSSLDNSISPSFIEIGMHPLGNVPHDAFTKLAYPLSAFSSVKTSIGFPIRTKSKLVQHICGVLNKSGNHS